MRHRLRTLIINFKNYERVLGAGSVELARAADKVAAEVGAEIIVAPPSPTLALVASKVNIRVFAQAISPDSGDKTTGAVTAEAVKAAGAVGTLLNHSEARLPRGELKAALARSNATGLEVCLCARTSSEAAILSRLGTKYLAVEPPELIGTGTAVSTAKPGVVSKTVEAAKKSGYKGRVLCGAGIVTGADVTKAVELGADGILVASSVAKASNWESKVKELARSLG